MPLHHASIFAVSKCLIDVSYVFNNTQAKSHIFAAESAQVLPTCCASTHMSNLESGHTAVFGACFVLLAVHLRATTCTVLVAGAHDAWL